jgi:hypothetical protein
MCAVAIGWVLLLGPVALQWLCGLGKRSLRRCTSEIGFIGRILEYIFYRLPFTPPSLVRCIAPSSGIRAGSGLIDSNQSKIQGWRTRNVVRVLHTSMERTTRCGVGGWRCSSAERVRSFWMSRWTTTMSSR